MPKQYEAIRDYFIEKGQSPEKAKERAAKIFIAKGKGKSSSARAKMLHADRPAKKGY